MKLAWVAGNRVTDMAQLGDEVLRLQRAGWIVRRAAGEQRLSPAVLARYPWIPPKVQSFFCEYAQVSRANEMAWLLSVPHFNGTSRSVYRWNELELQSLEGTRGDMTWQREIRLFWDEHLPIALSIEDGYSYHALKRDGSVVAGREPEYEEPCKAADSYEEFLYLLE